VRGAGERGAEAVLLIGGDCPELDTQMLERAAEQLAETDTDAVLGPALDGGFYLLGLRRGGPEIFREVDWGTERVAAQTRRRLLAAGLRWTELPGLRDIDTKDDWRAMGGREDGSLPGE